MGPTKLARWKHCTEIQDALELFADSANMFYLTRLLNVPFLTWVSKHVISWVPCSTVGYSFLEIRLTGVIWCCLGVTLHFPHLCPWFFPLHPVSLLLSVSSYLSEEDVKDEANPFVQLVSGVVWLLRNSQVYINQSIEAECDATQETGSYCRILRMSST